MVATRRINPRKRIAELAGALRRRREAIRQLRAISDLQVRDLGLNRLDLERWLLGEARQRPVKCFTPFE